MNFITLIYCYGTSADFQYCLTEAEYEDTKATTLGSCAMNPFALTASRWH